MDLPAKRNSGLGWAVGTLESSVMAFGKLLDRMFTEDMATGEEHGRVLSSALIA